MAKTINRVVDRISPTREVLRNHNLGIVLLSTLVSIFLLTSLVVTLQRRTQNNLTVFTRLENLHRSAPHKDAVHERLRSILATAMTAANSDQVILMDGTPFSIIDGDISWVVQINDVQGLVDIYLASPTVLGLLQNNAPNLQGLRQTAMSNLPLGARYSMLSTTLARFGLNKNLNARLTPYMTQSAQSGAINVEQSPRLFRRDAEQLEPLDQMMGQVRTVRILISE